MRLKNNEDFNNYDLPWYCQKMSVKFYDENAFFERIDTYVRENP